MKKFAVGFASLLLVGSLAAFAACDDGVRDDGTVPGNYREVSVQQAVQALDAVGADNLLGDTSADDWSLGMSVSGKASLSAEQGDDRYSVSAESGMQFSIGAGESDELALLLSSENSVSLEQVVDTETAVSSDADVNLYIADQYLYLNIAATASAGGSQSTDTTKTKVPLDLGGTPSLPSTPSGSEIDFSTLLTDMADYGASISIDDSSGVKLRVSFTGEALDEVLREVFGSMYPVDSSSLDLQLGADAAVETYFVINAEGKLVSVSAKVDVDVTILDAKFDMTTGGYYGDTGNDIVFGCDASFAFEVGDVDVRLPGDLDTYPEGIL